MNLIFSISISYVSCCFGNIVGGCCGVVVGVGVVGGVGVGVGVGGVGGGGGGGQPNSQFH